jgi:hypothetical protein
MLQRRKKEVYDVSYSLENIFSVFIVIISRKVEREVLLQCLYLA